MGSGVFPKFIQAVHRGEVDIDTDAFKCMLLTSAYTPSANHLNLTDFSSHEIAAGNGYTAGGQVVTVSYTYDETAKKFFLTCTDPIWTANGGSIPDWQYGVFYDDTHANKIAMFLFAKAAASGVTDGNNTGIDVAGAGLFAFSSPTIES